MYGTMVILMALSFLTAFWIPIVCFRRTTFPVESRLVIKRYCRLV